MKVGRLGYEISWWCISEWHVVTLKHCSRCRSIEISPIFFIVKLIERFDKVSYFSFFFVLAEIRLKINKRDNSIRRDTFPEHNKFTDFIRHSDNVKERSVWPWNVINLRNSTWIKFHLSIIFFSHRQKSSIDWVTHDPCEISNQSESQSVTNHFWGSWRGDDRTTLSIR